METLKPNARRAQNAITLIWIVMALDIASLISGAMQYNLLTDARNGVAITGSAAEANDWRERIVAFASLIAMVVSAVTFIQWFRRAYFNLHQKINDLQQPENQAATSWFIPFVNLGRPYSIMKEMYDSSRRFLETSGAVMTSQLSTGKLKAWWALWIVNGVASQAVSRFTLKAESIDELISSTAASMVLDVIGIPLAIITVRVIKDYASIEPLLSGSVEIDDQGTLDSAPIGNN